MEVHVFLEGVFGGERFGADGAHKRLFSSVHALVSQQSVLLGKTFPTNEAPKRLLSWGTVDIQVSVLVYVQKQVRYQRQTLKHEHFL